MSAKNVSGLGILVVKASQALPQTATANLFTQSGGSVLVTGLLGLVTTATGATVTGLTLGTTAGNATITASTAIASLAAGTWLLPVANNTPAAMTIKAGGAAFLSPSVDRQYAPFVLSPGQNITWTTSAGDTGQMAWYLWYIPIDADSGLS